MQDWMNIHRAANMIEADLLRGKLESEGIPVMLKYEIAGQMYGITVDGLSEVLIFVPRELRAEAIEILGKDGPQEPEIIN